MFAFFHRWQERRAKERRLRLTRYIEEFARGPNPTMGKLVRALLKEGVRPNTAEYDRLKAVAREYSHIILPDGV